MNVFNKHRWILERPIAHRGLHSKKEGLPENSIGAFKAAIQKGFPIELDIHLTKDNEIVVFHDWNISRMTGFDKDITSLTKEEVSNYHLCGTEYTIPTLKEVLQLVNGRVPLLIEIKNRNYFPLYMEEKLCGILCKMMRNYEGEYAIQSFNPWSVYYMKKKLKHVPVGQLSDDYKRKKAGHFYSYIFRKLITECRFNFITKPDFVSYNVRHLPKTYLKPIKHGGDRALLGWTVRDKKYQQVAKECCDNIIFEEGYYAD